VRFDEKLALRVRMPSLRVTAALATVFATVGVATAPCATADPTDTLRAAVAAVRGAGSCGPLRSDPTVDQVAQKVNQSTDDWLNFTSRAVPETDALPPLKDFGHPANKAAILSSGTPDSGTAVKALVLQGFAKIPDCTYTSFGVATTYNVKKGIYLMTAVLAG
jgi:uncharacterized protein YkwD